MCAFLFAELSYLNNSLALGNTMRKSSKDGGGKRDGDNILKDRPSETREKIHAQLWPSATTIVHKVHSVLSIRSGNGVQFEMDWDKILRRQTADIDIAIM